MSPLVSICLPNLNSAAFIRERLASIHAQSHVNWECIICDSNSNDGSREVLESWTKTEPRATLYSVPLRGIYPAWNECLDRAKGDYIYFATSDDTMEPNCLETAVDAMERTLEADWCHFPVTRIDATGNLVGDPLRDAPAAAYYQDWMLCEHLRDGSKESLRMLCLGSLYLSVTGMLFRNRGHLRFPTDKEEIGDYFFYLQEARELTILYLPTPLAAWRIHDRQATRPLEERLHKQLRFLAEFVADQPPSDRRWAERALAFRRYGCRKQIARTRFGKAGMLIVMLTTAWGWKELALILRRTPHPYQSLARTLVGIEDLRTTQHPVRR